MGSSPTVEAPQPSAQETALMQKILDQLTEQKTYNDMMFPKYAWELGYKVETTPGVKPEYTTAQQSILDQQKEAQAIMAQQNLNSDSGRSVYNIYYDKLQKLNTQVAQIESERQTIADTQSKKLVKMSDEEWYSGMTESEKRQYDLTKETQTRQLKALKGELPLTESLQQRKSKEFEQLKSTYGITGNDLDTAVAQDTIGTQNLSEFKKRWNSLEEQERYGQLASGTQSTVAMTGLASDITNRNIGNLSSIGGQNAGLTQGYYSLLQPYMAYTQAGYQAQAQNQLTQSQQNASLLALMGMGVGGAIGGVPGAMIGGAAGNYIGSSKKFKTGIKTKTKKNEDKALKDITNTRSVEYKYKKGMGLGTIKHIGAIAEEVPKAIANTSRTAINLSEKLELTNMALKSLTRKVEKIGSRI